MAAGKHVALATELEKDILAGKYGWEGGLPGAGELAQKWNMSINTVKNSLALLEGKGLIEKRGIGYYIKRMPFHRAQEKENINAVFAQATPNDMPGVYKIAAKLFQSVSPISAERRQEWMEAEQRGHYVVRRDDDTIVAYVHFLALSDSLIERYMHGEIFGKQLTKHDILPLTPGQPLLCIIPSIAVDPELPKALQSNYMGVLFRGIHNDLIELGKQGIIIAKLYAWTHWNSGIEICAKMGMQPWSLPVKLPGETRRYNYWLDVLNSPMPLLAGYRRALQEWRAIHQSE